MKVGNLMKYTMSKKDSYFVKNEGANSIVISKVNGHSVFLNRVATWLFNQLSTYTSSEELFEKMKQQYAGVNHDILKKDLVSFLHVMDVYQIITLDNEDIEDEDVAYKISFAEDSTYRRICDFICASETKCWLTKPIPEVPFTPLVLHQKNFANEEVFLQYVKDNETRIVVGFKMPVPESKVLVLNRVFSRNIDSDELVAGIHQVLRRFLARVTDAPKKTRVIVYQGEDVKQYNDIVDLLQRCGFYKECELKNEIDNINVDYYCLYN